MKPLICSKFFGVNVGSSQEGSCCDGGDLKPGHRDAGELCIKHRVSG